MYVNTHFTEVYSTQQRTLHPAEQLESRPVTVLVTVLLHISVLFIFARFLCLLLLSSTSRRSVYGPIAPAPNECVRRMLRDHTLNKDPVVLSLPVRGNYGNTNIKASFGAFKVLKLDTIYLDSYIYGRRVVDLYSQLSGNKISGQKLHEIRMLTV